MPMPFWILVVTGRHYGEEREKAGLFDGFRGRWKGLPARGGPGHKTRQSTAPIFPRLSFAELLTKVRKNILLPLYHASYPFSNFLVLAYSTAPGEAGLV